MKTIATLIAETIEALHKAGRYDAIARLVPHLDVVAGLPESKLGQGIFSVVDHALSWKDTPEGLEYWTKVYECMAFETGGAFRNEVDKLLDTVGLDDHEAWHALEGKRLEIDSNDKSFGDRLPAFAEAVTTVVDGGVSFISEHEGWLAVIHHFLDSEIVDWKSRIEFESPFKARKGDAKAMYPTKAPKYDGWILLGETEGEVTLSPDGEELSKDKTLDGSWYLYLEPSEQAKVHAVRKGRNKEGVTSSFAEGLNRIFRGQRDLISEAVRFAFLHDRAEFGFNVKEK